MTTQAWTKLKKKEKILLAVDKSLALAKKDIPYEEVLLDQLKALRFQMAQKENVPPYIIFSDASLVEMATYFPNRPESLLSIAGVGQVKAERFGEAFMDIIKKYIQEHGLHPQKKLSSSKPSAPKISGTSKSELLTLQYYKEGLKTFQIAQKREMALSTVEGHLAKLVQLGKIEAETLVPKDDLLTIRLAYRRIDSPYLKPLKEHFGERFSYFQLKVALVGESKK